MSPPPDGPPRLFLVDAYALIYRAFFAFIRQPLTNTRGENTSAPWGFLNFLLSLRDDHDPAYLAVVFDAGLSGRDEVFPEYKATRERMPDELRASLPRIRELVGAFNDEIVEVDGYEADDVIGTLARQAAGAGVEAVVVSGDKDFHQLVGPGIRLLNPGRGGASGVAAHWIDESNASERLGVAPDEVADFLALVGDASDNVPGAPGIGPGWARRLLTEIGPLDEIVAHPERIPWKSKRHSIENNADQILLSRRLVTIQTDLPIELDLERLRLGEPDYPRLRELCVDLGFRSLLERFSRTGDPDSEGEAGGSGYRVISAAPEVDRAVAEARQAGRVALKLLATSPEPMRATPVGLSLVWEAGTGVYLPLGHEPPPPEPPPEAGDTVGNLPPITGPGMDSLRELLEDPEFPKVGHDLKEEMILLRRAGVRFAGADFDTMVASYVLDPGRRQHTVGFVSADVLHRAVAPLDELTGRGRKRIPVGEVAPEAACNALCRRAEVSLELASRFGTELAEEGAERLFRSLEMPLVPLLSEMEEAGIRIDPAVFTAMSRRLGEDLTLVREEILKEAGESFNVNSNPQLRRVLFEKLGLPVLKRTKTGPSTDASVLEELAARGYTLPRHLLDYRQLEKLRSTYVDALPKLVNPSTGRIHASFNQAVAATGRLSSSNPNLQNIPIRTDLGREIRKGFVAEAGHLLFAADYSQIELRILAHFSGDPAFVTAFREGVDIHRQTASVIFGIPVGEVTPEERTRAKTINFATLYGQGDFSLGRQLGIPRREAARFIQSYFERFSGVRTFLDRQIEMAKEKGYVETLSGRRRYVPELRSGKWNVRQFGERVAQNTPIQGSAADLIKEAMIRIRSELREAGLASRLLVQVHDELLFEVPAQELDHLREIVVRNMEGAMDLTVPLRVDAGAGHSWYDCKG